MSSKRQRRKRSLFLFQFFLQFTQYYQKPHHNQSNIQRKKSYYSLSLSIPPSVFEIKAHNPSITLLLLSSVDQRQFNISYRAYVAGQYKGRPAGIPFGLIVKLCSPSPPQFNTSCRPHQNDSAVDPLIIIVGYCCACCCFCLTLLLVLPMPCCR